MTVAAGVGLSVSEHHVLPVMHTSLSVCGSPSRCWGVEVMCNLVTSMICVTVWSLVSLSTNNITSHISSPLHSPGLHNKELVGPLFSLTDLVTT